MPSSPSASHRRQAWQRALLAWLTAALALVVPLVSVAPVSAQNGTAQPAVGDQAAATGQMSFYVAGFRFTGNTAFSGETLATAVAGYSGRELTLPELRDAADRVEAFYHQAGYFLATVYVPPQEVVDGIVEIGVVEGRYGDVALADDPALKERIVRAVLAQVRPGELIREQPLDRAVRLLSEVPGVQSRASLRPGAAPGTSDVTVSVARARPLRGGFTVDNAGSAATAVVRTMAFAELANPSRMGDRLAVQWLGAGAGMEFWSAAYDTWALAPWRLGVSFSNSGYKLGGVFAPIDMKGTTSAWQLSARYPLLRARGQAWDLSLAYESKTTRDSQLGEETPALVQALSATWRAGWPVGTYGGALSRVAGDAWVSVIPGSVTFLSEEAAQKDAAGLKTAGGFVRLQAGLTARRALSSQTALLLSVFGQWASKNLHRSEKFSLGGPDGVRAYPGDAASGDMGLLLRAEVRFAPQASGPWVHGLDVGAFIDYGAVQLNHTPKAGSPVSNRVSLAGAGIGLNYMPTAGTALRVEYAVPFGGENAPAGQPRLWARLDVRL
ncbi:MAG: hypothetical protein BAA04_11270 [Firmicutes bacterium ZCTH02-B6]|nr:MAG: hypothetical protein BAA04_11270 [Firmicutes bacterium ZCTH02-B6]